MKKRIIFKLCAFVLAFASGGAIINVAVAWGMVLRSRAGIQPPIRAYDDMYPSFFRNNYPPGAGGELLSWVIPQDQERRSLPVSKTIWYGQRFQAARMITSDPNSGVESRVVTGWPRTGNASLWFPEGIIADALTADFPRNLVVSPINPIWPGFAINTVFYAAVLWLLWLTPGFVKRRIRVMRGRCRACGYDLHNRNPDSTCCPECGGTV